jgi:hypothetical protein
LKGVIKVKKHYADFYGCTASIAKITTGYRLRIRTSLGKVIKNCVYNTERGAKSAMSRASDGWREV